jgi:hypothetical protein
MSLRSIERVRVPTPSELDWLRAELLCDGFALIPAVLPPDLTDRLREELRALAVQTPVSGGPAWCRDHECGEPGSEPAGELVDELVALEPLLTLARALLGVECVPLRTEYFGTPGQPGGPTPARQDQALHAGEVTGELTVTLWCPLSDMGADDGVREYAIPNAVPGQLLEHVDPPAPGSGSELPDPERFTFRPVPLRCGDIVAHHAYAVHRSGANRSGRRGEAIALSYRSSARRMWPPR